MEADSPSDSSGSYKVSKGGNSLVNSGFPNGSISSANAWFVGAEKLSGFSSLTENNAFEMSSGNGDTYFLRPSLPVRDFPDNVESLLNKHGGANAFSSSLPVLLSEKLKHSSTLGPYVEAGGSSLDRELGEEALGSVNGEIVLQTIGHILPDDEEELLAGIAEGFDRMKLNNTTEENDEFDLFSSGGGLEMDGEIQECYGVYMSNPKGMEGFPGNSAALHGTSSGPGSVVGEHPYGEHPSRTLFVRNINSNVEDSELRTLFEQYGDIRTLYTTCKHRGFVMISYYDIRSARSAMRGLQNKPLRRRKLDIHFSIPKDNPSDKDINQGTLVVFNLDASVSNDDLRQIFGQYGEVKEIRETPHKRHHKFIEFYDVRAAEAALRALNRSDIAGKRIKLEPSRPGGARRSLVQQLTQELEQEETRSYRQQSATPNTNSPPGHPSSWGRFGSPVDNGLSRNLHHSIGTLIPGVNKPLPGLPVTLPHSSSGRVGTIGSHLGFPSVPTGVKPVPLHHAHSLPEYRNGTMQFYNHSVSIRGAASPHGVHDGVGGLRLSRTASSAGNDSLFENAPGAVGIPSDSSLRRFNSGSGGGTSLSGRHFLWGSSSPYQQNSPSVAWPMPGMGHGFNPVAHSQSQTFGYSGTQGHFVNTVLPAPRHHVGSAPSGDPSLIERQFGYFAESPDTPFFNSPGHGIVGVPGSTGSTLINGGHGIINSGSIGNNGGFESAVSPNVGIISPGHRTHLFQAAGIPMSVASDGIAERGRLRRTESGVIQADNKKQYQLDIDRILRGEDVRTTLMIKNIPNKYTSKMLLAAIDENHRGTYDFLYLPIDFKNKCNVGYAFINMTSPAHIIPIYRAFNGKKWEKFNSEKVASLAYARIQGKAALVAHFQNSSLMNEDKRCRPILFHSEESEIGEQDQSSLGASIRTQISRDSSGSGEFLEGTLNSGIRDSSVSGIAEISSGGMVPSSSEKD